jgi:hypothetical protein
MEEVGQMEDEFVPRLLRPGSDLNERVVQGIVDLLRVVHVTGQNLLRVYSLRETVSRL